jgi:glutamate--cysteine ligase catalytic subunit
MGLLFLGTPYTWEEGKKYADHVRQHGITQFLYTWDRAKNRQGDELLWGDEVRTFTLPIAVNHMNINMLHQLEYMVVSFDDKTKSAKLSLRQGEILQKLSNIVSDLCEGCTDS